jgi:hypothetical protein
MKTLICAATLAAMMSAATTAQAQTGGVAPTQESATSATSATLAWNKIALESIERAKPTQHQAIRLLTHVSLAQYAALAGANEVTARDAVAAASARVIAELMPTQASFAQERYRQSQAGTNDAGLRAAQRVLDEARSDGFGTAWNGQVPQAAWAWRSLVNPPAPPAYPAIGDMRTFFTESGNSFRSVTPPAPGTARFTTDSAEVRAYTEAPTAETTRIAKFYDMTTGTLAGGFWNERAAELIRKHAAGERQSATVLVTLNAAMMDALVACHDAKYVYWVPRPSQADPSIKPLIGVPNHPSYPSNHSCLSTAAGQVLAHFFPQERPRMESIAKEAGASRIYAGLHYRFDVEAGDDIGRKVANVAIARHAQMLAKWTQPEAVARQATRD